MEFPRSRAIDRERSPLECVDANRLYRDVCRQLPSGEPLGFTRVGGAAGADPEEVEHLPPSVRARDVAVCR